MLCKLSGKAIKNTLRRSAVYAILEWVSEMNQVELPKETKEYLTTLFDFSHVPIRIFDRKHGEPLAMPESPEFWLNLPFQKELRGAGFAFLQTPGLISLSSDFIMGYFCAGEEERSYQVVVGPVYSFNQPFLHLPQVGRQPMPAEKINLLSHFLPSMSVGAFCAYLRLLVKCLQKRDISASEILQGNFPAELVPDMERELFSTVFSQREQPHYHSPYEAEKRFIRNVRNGDMEAVEAAIQKTRNLNVGTLSGDPFRQICYISIALVTLVTRAAIEGGLEESVAFILSDIYIQRMDAASSNNEIVDISMHMLRDFTLRVREHKKQADYSRPVAQAIRYIHQNLHNKMTVPEIAAEVYLSPDHLSRLFHKETGSVITSYIQKERIEEAKDALRFSNYSSLDIANYLCFSSQSYFNQIFKKYTGLTPNEYRKKHQ